MTVQSLPEAILEETTVGVPEGLSRVGEILRSAVDEMLQEFAGRVEADPLIPMAATLPASEIRDHGASLLVDVAQSLVSLDGSDANVADFLRDGTEIQRLISHLHGAQRTRLGWTEEGMRREFQILRELIAETLRHKTAARGVEIDRAIQIIDRFVNPAERISLKSWHRSTTEVG